MLTLSNAELHEITGYARVSAQIKWLKQNNWIFVVNAAGRPIVLRTYLEQRLGGVVAADQVAEPEFQHVSLEFNTRRISALRRLVLYNFRDL